MKAYRRHGRAVTIRPSVTTRQVVSMNRVPRATVEHATTTKVIDGTLVRLFVLGLDGFDDKNWTLSF